MPAVSVHHTATTDAAWDANAQVGKLGDDYTTADLKAEFAWVPDGADPKKSACKMPHHVVDGDGKPGAASIKACESVISILNGGMGGADIPDADRKGVYDHVAAHLKDAGKTPAELKSAPTVPDRSVRGERRTAVEHRALPFRDVELRAVADGSGGETLTFSGYACVTEQSYEMYDLFGPYTEVVRQGAFKKTLSEGADVPFLVNHEGLTLARTKSGTLRLAEDGTGLHTEADLDPSSPHVQALRSAMERKDIDEMSFGFWVTRQQWSPDWEQRDILEVNLNKGDVSVVNYGANPHTAGATLNSRDLSAHLERLTPDERREVFDRLAAEFRTPEPAPVLLTTRPEMLAWAQAQAAELRAGATLSADTLATLQQVLDLVAAADDNVDEAQEVLSDLMGVPNPDDDDDATEPGSDANGGEPQENGAELDLYVYRARALAL
jgi:HK97 family phage prohead protease